MSDVAVQGSCLYAIGRINSSSDLLVLVDISNPSAPIFEAGAHTVAFDGAGHASGNYIVRMNTGDFEKAQKVILLK